MRKLLLALGVLALMYSCERECGLCITNMDDSGAPLGYEDTIMVCDGFEEQYCIRAVK
jgi:hypothetical protein